MVVKNHLHSSSDVHNSRVGHNNQSKKHLSKNFLVEIKLSNRKKVLQIQYIKDLFMCQLCHYGNVTIIICTSDEVQSYFYHVVCMTIDY
jgi:hypothetical protein